MKNDEQYVDEIFQKYNKIQNTKEEKLYKKNIIISPVNAFFRTATVILSWIALTGCVVYSTSDVIDKVFKEPEMMTYQESISINEEEKKELISEDKTNNSKPVTSKDVKETPKENTASSVLKETTPDLSGQVSVVPYAMTEDEIKEVNSGNSHTFIGTVTNINDVAVIIKPDEGYDGVSGNQITLVKSECGAGLNVNDRVEITFIGQVTKTYPGNIHVVAIKKI